jgi:hypothetical protein
MPLSRFLILAVLSFSLFISACKKDGSDKPIVLTVDFSHKANGEAVQFDTILYSNSLNQAFSISTCKYFLSNIYLHSPTGDSSMVEEYIYVDGSDAINSSFSREIKPNTYNKISLNIGIPTAQNISNMFPNPPENKMEWPTPMGGGYHYMKLEGKYEDSSTNIRNFQMHTGPLNKEDYSVWVELPLDLNLESVDRSLELIIHLDNWFKSPNQLSFYNLSAIMGNATMQSKIQANGNDIIEVGIIE